MREGQQLPEQIQLNGFLISAWTHNTKESLSACVPFGTNWPIFMKPDSCIMPRKDMNLNAF
jgi:hypothetical protein